MAKGLIFFLIEINYEHTVEIAWNVKQSNILLGLGSYILGQYLLCEADFIITL